MPFRAGAAGSHELRGGAGAGRRCVALAPAVRRRGLPLVRGGGACPHTGRSPVAAGPSGGVVPCRTTDRGAVFSAAGCHPRASGLAASGPGRVAAKTAGRYDVLKRQCACLGGRKVVAMPLGISRRGMRQQRIRRNVYTKTGARVAGHRSFLCLWAGRTAIMWITAQHEAGGEEGDGLSAGHSWQRFGKNLGAGSAGGATSASAPLPE